MKNSDKHGSNIQQDRSSNFAGSPPFTPIGATNHTPGIPQHLTGEYSLMGRSQSICNCSAGGVLCAACVNGDFYQNDVAAGGGSRITSSGACKSGGQTSGGGFVPPNQEQLALMEELSIEYHNLYSKRATVEDVISNVPVSSRINWIFSYTQCSLIVSHLPLMLIIRIHIYILGIRVNN